MIVDHSTYFSAAELQCKCGCDQALMDQFFLSKLDALRAEYDRPIILTSAYRCPDHNDAESGTGRTGPHTTGAAVDIATRGHDCYELIGRAIKLNFTGIGIKQHGDKRFLHLDNLPNAPGQPRPWVWSYS